MHHFKLKLTKKWCRPGAIFQFKIHRNAFAGEADSAPPDPLVGFRAVSWQVSIGEGRKGEKRGWESRKRKGEEMGGPSANYLFYNLFTASGLKQFNIFRTKRIGHFPPITRKIISPTRTGVSNAGGHTLISGTMLFCQNGTTRATVSLRHSVFGISFLSTFCRH